MSDGWGDPIGLPNGRPVAGSTRPTDCPIFRRILSPAGQVELWSFEFRPGQTTETFPTGEIDRVTRAVGRLPTTFELYGQLGTDDARATSSAARVSFIRDQLIRAGARADRLVVASRHLDPVRPGDPRRGHVYFHVVDRTLIRTEDFCFPRRD